MSSCALFYALSSLYSFFGLQTNKFIDISQSYFASFKLSAILLGCFFETSLPISYYFEFNFTVMTLLITIDSYYGFNELIRETRLKSDSLIEEEKRIFVDNWKTNLFYKERQSSELLRTFGLLLITLEGIFSFSSMFYPQYYLFVSFIQSLNFDIVNRFWYCFHLLNHVLLQLLWFVFTAFGKMLVIRHRSLGNHSVSHHLSSWNNQYSFRNDANYSFCN